MTSVTTQCRRVITVSFAAAATGTYEIPYSANFSRAIVQCVGGNAGADSIDLYASLDPATPATHFLVGEDIGGTVNASPQLTGPTAAGVGGVLFYTKSLALPLILAYTVKGAPAVSMDLVIRLYDDNYQGTQTRSV